MSKLNKPHWTAAFMSSWLVLLFALTFRTALLGESKTEMELRLKLAASEAQRAAAVAAAARYQAALAASVKATKTASSQAGDDAAIASAYAQESIVQQATIAAAAAAAANTAASKADMARESYVSGTQSLMITTVAGFLTMLCGLLFQMFTAARDRRWAQEDSARHQQNVLGKLEEVKGAADSAYKEANTVNLKIASIGVQMKDGSPLEKQP